MCVRGGCIVMRVTRIKNCIRNKKQVVMEREKERENKNVRAQGMMRVTVRLNARLAISTLLLSIYSCGRRSTRLALRTGEEPSCESCFLASAYYGLCRAIATHLSRQGSLSRGQEILGGIAGRVTGGFRRRIGAARSDQLPRRSFRHRATREDERVASSRRSYVL